MILLHVSHCWKSAPCVWEWANLSMAGKVGQMLDGEQQWRCLVAAKFGGQSPDWRTLHRLDYRHARLALCGARCLQRMLNVGMSSSVLTDLGCSLLTLASSKGNVPAVEQLLERGAHGAADGGPLLEASQFGHLGVVRLLLAHARSGTQAQWRELLVQALCNACSEGHLQVAEFLISKGAPAGGGSNSVPLVAAARCGDERLVLLLLKLDAEVDAHEESGGSALWLASSSGRAALVKILVDAGADLNFRCRSCDSTPLMAAASEGHAEVARLLLAKGASTELKGCRTGGRPARTALEIAQVRKRREVVKLLGGVTDEAPPAPPGMTKSQDTALARGAPISLEAALARPSNLHSAAEATVQSNLHLAAEAAAAAAAATAAAPWPSTIHWPSDPAAAMAAAAGWFQQPVGSGMAQNLVPPSLDRLPSVEELCGGSATFPVAAGGGARRAGSLPFRVEPRYPFSCGIRV